MEEEVPKHIDLNCTGNWTVGQSRMGTVITCRGCSAIFTATRARIDKALYENWVGSLLDTAANQGVYFLDNEVSGN